MRSQVRFFMDAADERRFVDAIIEEPNTYLVNGPHWESSAVPLVQPDRLADADSYLMVWNKSEVPRLSARRLGDFFDAYNDKTTIQFLRSSLWDDEILTEGRIAVATDDKAIEQRYKRLRKIIQRTFENGILCWFHPGIPKSAKNPSKSDRSVWVGAGALAWLRTSRAHKFKQERNAHVEAILCAGSAS
jgi:hypothetical protein